MEQREAQDKSIRKLKKRLDDYVRKVDEFESKQQLWCPFSRPASDRPISCFPHADSKKIPHKSLKMKAAVAPSAVNIQFC